MHYCFALFFFYQYNMLPMGVIVATVIFQARLGDLLGDIEHVLVFLHDILIIGTKTLDRHLNQVEAVWRRLLDTGIQINPLKAFCFRKKWFILVTLLIEV